MRKMVRWWWRGQKRGSRVKGTGKGGLLIFLEVFVEKRMGDGDGGLMNMTGWGWVGLGWGRWLVFFFFLGGFFLGGGGGGGGEKPHFRFFSFFFFFFEGIYSYILFFCNF